MYCTVLVANTCNKNINMLIIGKYEILNGYKSIRIDPSSYHILKDALKSNPLGREILPCINSQEQNVPIFSISNTKMRTPENMDVNDIDTEALFSQSPSYMGEAQIDEKTFEPRGIEVPTQLFNSTEEAIQLENFPVEVRKFTKRIFLERYPLCFTPQFGCR